MGILTWIALNINVILGLLSAVLAIATWVATHFNFQNKKLAQILNACLIAEKAIDRAAYNSDGTFNQARLDMAMSILKILDPKLDVADTEADIEKVLAGVHTQVTTVTVAPTVTNPPIPPAAVGIKKDKV